MKIKIKIRWCKYKLRFGDKKWFNPLNISDCPCLARIRMLVIYIERESWVYFIVLCGCSPLLDFSFCIGLSRLPLPKLSSCWPSPLDPRFIFVFLSLPLQINLHLLLFSTSLLLLLLFISSIFIYPAK